MEEANTNALGTASPGCDGTKDFPHQKGDGSWWENDAQGIALCRVCDECEDEKLSRYRPEILSGYNQSDVDEPIEADL